MDSNSDPFCEETYKSIQYRIQQYSSQYGHHFFWRRYARLRAKTLVLNYIFFTPLPVVTAVILFIFIYPADQGASLRTRLPRSLSRRLAGVEGVVSSVQGGRTKKTAPWTVCCDWCTDRCGFRASTSKIYCTLFSVCCDWCSVRVDAGSDQVISEVYFPLCTVDLIDAVRCRSCVPTPRCSRKNTQTPAFSKKRRETPRRYSRESQINAVNTVATGSASGPGPGLAVADSPSADHQTTDGDIQSSGGDTDGVALVRTATCPEIGETVSFVEDAEDDVESMHRMENVRKNSIVAQGDHDEASSANVGRGDNRDHDLRHGEVERRMPVQESLTRSLVTRSEPQS